MGATPRPGLRQVAAGTALLLGAAVLGGVASLPAAAQSVPVEEFRTEVPELGGYTAEALSSPISVLMFEPTIPVPAGPGEPHGEMHGSYSRATLATGPASRGLGSSVWPGPTAGDGLSAFDPNIPEYPFRANATYPDGPYEDLGQDGNPQENRGDPNTRTGMFAYARGIDVYGESNGGGELIPGLMDAGNTSTVSTSTVVDGVVVAETIASGDDISILNGVVTIDSFQTRLIARSNGEVAETEGAYEVSGLRIMGVEYEVTEEGAVVRAGDEEGDPSVTVPLGLGNQGVDFADLLGVKVEAAPVREEVDGPTGRRWTRGFTITLDTTPLRQALGFVPINEVIGLIPDVPGADVVPCDQVPPQMSAIPCYANPVTGLKSTLFVLAALQPETRFIFGGGEVSTTASLPFEFDFAPPPLPALPPPPASTGSTGQFTTPTFTSPPAPAPVAVEPAPQVAAPAPARVGTQVVALEVPEALSGGIVPGVAVLGMAGVALVARGGRRLTMAALYGAAGTPAAVGAAAVPDLRAFAGKGR